MSKQILDNNAILTGLKQQEAGLGFGVDPRSDPLDRPKGAQAGVWSAALKMSVNRFEND